MSYQGIGMVSRRVYVWIILVILSVLVATYGAEPQQAKAQACAGGTCSPPQANLTLGQLLLAAAPPSTPLVCPGQLTTAPNPTDYVRTNGAAFVYHAAPIKFYGYTFYPSSIGGTSAWHQPGFTQYIDHIMLMGSHLGQNLIRPTNFWSRNPHVQNPAQGSDIVWKNMDYLVCAAKSHGVFVAMDLSAFAYLLIDEHLNDFDANNWQAFLIAVGKHYSKQSSIAFYSIVGEPTVPTTAAAMKKLVAFYRQTTDTLHAVDPYHLITAGAFNHMNGEVAALPWWQQIYSLPNNNFAAFKTYSINDLRLLSQITAFAARIGKPALDAEFGMVQRMGDATFAGGPGVYGLQMSRAQFYQRVYSSPGIQGFIFWNLGCGLGPNTYEVNPKTPATWNVVKQYGPDPRKVGLGITDATLCP